MGAGFAAVAWIAAIVMVAAALVTVLHRALRPRELNARSATALRELEPRGGRHRFHVRLFEVTALASACVSALGALLVVASARGDAMHPARAMIVVVGGGALLVAVWWAWRRGALRAVEAEPPSTASSLEETRR